MLLVVLALGTPVTVLGQESELVLDPSGMLQFLEGSWTFNVYDVGSAEPRATGVREYREVLPGHPSLTWTERFDGRQVIVAGLMGYDAAAAHFFELGYASEGPVDHWLGEVADGGTRIVWHDPMDPVAPSRGELEVLDESTFEFRRGEFLAVFRRSGAGS